ncbi:MAG: hypothetical protein ROZ64_13645 [Burkholderiaceae bacterium]|jgi:hypothetical protein|nr:hypothetical protein [Burkholderiaceae bacterium]
MIDHDKLAELRDAHKRQHAAYRELAEQARQAAQDAGRQRAEMFADPLFGNADNRFAHATTDELDAASTEDIEAAGLRLKDVRALVHAERRAKGLAARAAADAESLKSQRALLDNVENYVRQFEARA